MPFTFYQTANNAETTLNGNITNSATTLVVNTTTNFPLTGNFLCTIWNKASYPDPFNDSTMEIVLVTGVSGSTFTITRAQEGTTAQAHNNGNAVELLFTAGTLQQVEKAINNIQDYLSYSYFGGV